ncbi:hypothetical protein [Nocardia sp. NPDC059239]|uniref:hypothetical protein n=1 Tax=Nocardia sp. NPDC059239 TaxID=3346785 RepID=UPI00369F702B
MSIETPSTESTRRRQPWEITVRDLHVFLLGRGWVTEDVADLDEDGWPLSGLVNSPGWWCYPPSYGGAVMNRVDEVTPEQLSCHISTDDDGTNAQVLVTSAGNLSGCELHIVCGYSFDLDDRDYTGLDLADLAESLDVLEPQARAIDPRELIECRFFGPCGAQAV